ncbi:hypothetical protein MOQ72_29210 [Saccharopolyspora sp. K220]|uniref:hypothetical protein n=1 Tax=Saccharopolyspora soli TaxID=2926618 RepID=UPI001F5974F9|nr:hypothetical protein [Saccharopolyspora soli]MCI2421521.1 hypothetical protein [Saccharopolyspora soli]
MFDNVYPEPPPWKRGDDRKVHPPRPVWVDLARLYPAPEEIRPNRQGWDVQDVVPGELTAWLRTTTGAWIAEVQYRIRRGDGSEGVRQHGWLPADAVEPRNDALARKDQH